jgi:hypothetical protein
MQNTARQEHGARVDEVGREDAAGLRDRELLPGRARAAGYGAGPGSMQELPHRGGRNRVAEFHELLCTRRRPQVGMSVAMRITSLLIAAAVDGRPGRRRLE